MLCYQSFHAAVKYGTGATDTIRTQTQHVAQSTHKIHAVPNSYCDVSVLTV